MLDRVGETVPFAKAYQLLAVLAGIELYAKRIERCSEDDGAILHKPLSPKRPPSQPGRWSSRRSVTDPRSFMWP
jgi:hypothetical protein